MSMPFILVPKGGFMMTVSTAFTHLRCTLRFPSDSFSLSSGGQSGLSSVWHSVEISQRMKLTSVSKFLLFLRAICKALGSMSNPKVCLEERKSTISDQHVGRLIFRVPTAENLGANSQDTTSAPKVGDHLSLYLRVGTIYSEQHMRPG